MTLIYVALAVLICVTASATAYFCAVSRVLSKVVKKQERQHRRDVRRSDHLLDRLVMRHGFTALSEPVKSSESSAVLSMPIADPFEYAEQEWEKEDRERFRRMMDDDEKAELIAEAQKRVG